MNIVYAHEVPNDTKAPSIFLAGPSPRDPIHPNWRPEALNILTGLMFAGTIFIPLPRSGQWLPNYEAQVDWELAYLHAATVLAFWIPRDLKMLPGFTTNVEFGIYVNSGKIVLGFPLDAPKMRYLAHVARIHNVPVYHTLGQTMVGALNLLQKRP